MKASRLDLMEPVLSGYRRRFSVLDLGCQDGNMLEAIRPRYDAALFGLDRVGPAAILKTDVTPAALEKLAEVEYFDVVLALNFLHHFGSGWERAALAVLRLGHHVFIQLPPRGTIRVAGEEILSALHYLIDASGATLLGAPWYPSFNHHRPLWLFTCEGEHTVSSSGRPWTVLWDPVRQRATRYGQERDWIPGMNLWSMHGLGADRAWLADLVSRIPMPDPEHGDLMPWNMIWDGERIHLIDSQHEPGGHKGYDDPDGIRKTLELLSKDNTDWSF